MRCTELGKIQVKGIKDAITAYSPEEVTADLAKIIEARHREGRGASLES